VENEMELKKRGDLLINGFGASGGGQFNRASINGIGTINSDVECSEFDCNGVGTINGSVKSGKAKVNGKAKFKKNMECTAIDIEGAVKIEGDLIGETIKISGKASVGGSVKGEEIILKGALTVTEDCEAETFKAESQFKIGGLLNAEHVDIKMFGPCKAKEIGGQNIIVKQKGSLSLFGNLLKPIYPPQLETELIEGDQIHLENTNAKIVRGNHVVIGPNCNIGLIEYKDKLEVNKKSMIANSKKV
jgi:cytoskeletal protein CcmA (bactofilin family)